MKKTFLLSLLSTILLFSCSKESKKTEDSFIVNGVSDLALAKDTEINLPLEIKHVTATQEKVTITVEGLPAGVRADVSSLSGTPTFMTSIKFYAQEDAIVGTKQISIKASGSSGTTKTYDLALNVTPQVNCGRKLHGSYEVVTLRYKDGKLDRTDKHGTSVVPHSSSEEMILIKNYDFEISGEQELFLKALCESKTLEVHTKDLYGTEIRKVEFDNSYNKIYIEYVRTSLDYVYKATLTKW